MNMSVCVCVCVCVCVQTACMLACVCVCVHVCVACAYEATSRQSSQRYVAMLRTSGVYATVAMWFDEGLLKHAGEPVKCTKVGLSVRSATSSTLHGLFCVPHHTSNHDRSQHEGRESRGP